MMDNENNLNNKGDEKPDTVANQNLDETVEQRDSDSVETVLSNLKVADDAASAKKAKRKRKGKKALIICAIVLAGIILLGGIFATVNAVGTSALLKMGNNYQAVDYAGTQLVPVKENDGFWTFTTDDAFKVLQFTDVHIGAGFGSQKKDGWALNAVAAMIKAEKPDLVIVTGDIGYPVFFQAGTFNNLNAAKIFANLMENLGVYWTFAFGNHDTEAYSYYNRAELCDYYTKADYKYCLFERGPENIQGYGNNLIKVKNSENITTHAFVTLDSHSYTDGDYFGVYWKYDNIYQNQVDWYATEIDKINTSNRLIDVNAADVVNTAYFHIPLREYRDAWSEYLNNNSTNTENVTYEYGVLGENVDAINSMDEKTYGIFCGIGNDNFFEVGGTKNLKGVFCGHDHYNNFSVTYKGIRLTYGMSIDYLAYSGIWKEKSQRGCTVITVNTDGSFACEASNYYQDKYVAEQYKQ